MFGRPVGVAQNGGVRESRLPRVRASELVGRGWLNTGGRTVTLADLRGKIVLLDFWTFCCINCLHVLDELRELEEKYARRAGDRRRALAEVRARGRPGRAGRRRRALRGPPPGARRPGAGRPGRRTPRGPGRRSCVIDPEGYVVAQMAGEGHAHTIDDPGRRAGRGARGQGHAAPRRRPVRPAGAAPRARSGSPPRRSRCPTATCWSPTPGTTAWSSSRPTARRWSGASGPASAGSSTAVPTRRGSASRTGCAWCPTSCGRGSGTTCSSPTPSTTRCAACGSPTARDHRRRHRRAVHGRRGRQLPGVDDEPDEERPRAGDRRAGRRGRRVARPDAGTFVPGPRRHKLRPRGTSPGRSALGAFVVAMAGNHRCGRSTTSRARSSCSAGTMNEGLLDGPLARGVVRAAVRARRRRRRPALAGRLRDVRAALGRPGGADGAHRRRRRAVRLRPPRRPRRRGAAAAPARRRRAARRLGRRRRHLQRRGAPVRRRRGHDARHRPGRAERARRARRRLDAARRRVRRAPAHPDRAARDARRPARWTPARTARSGPSPSCRPARSRLDVVFTPAAGQKYDDRYGPSTRLLVSSTPPGLLLDGRRRRRPARPGAAPRPGRAARASCTSPRTRPPATPTPRSSTRPAT